MSGVGGANDSEEAALTPDGAKWPHPMCDADVRGGRELAWVNEIPITEDREDRGLPHETGRAPDSALPGETLSSETEASVLYQKLVA